MPKVGPKLVNRGAAGLLNKVKLTDKGKEVISAGGPELPAGRKNHIAKALAALTVDIATLTPDPNNGRLHPERNMDAIKASLRLYGQVKPIVVRKKGLVVVAGNGTLAAAKQLGWTRIAATVVDMTDVEAAGYGLADNRSAELAQWDFEVVARLDKLLLEEGHSQVGWTMEELSVLRQNVEEYVPIQGNEDGDQSWQELWKGMPEFDQQDLSSFKHVVVHLRSEEDFLKFLELVGQEPGDVRQKSIWYPKAEIGHFADKRYVSTNGDGEQPAKKAAPVAKRGGK